MSKKQINLLKPSPSSAEIEAVTKVLESSWWGMGPVTKQFEQEFAEYVGAKYCVAVNSATSALHLAVRILNDKKEFKGGNIIVPSLTFVSTGLVGLYENLDVIFADIDEETLCIDPQDVKAKCTPDTVAVIPVHYAGITAPTKFEVPVIEDAAHAVGNKAVGKNGVMACWSFHPVKNLATGDMGAVTTNDKEIYEKLIRLRWCGITLDTWSREKKGYNWEYDITEVGYKYHANDIMSSIALAQLHRMDELNGRRKQIADFYRKELADLPIQLPPESQTNHLFVIRVDAAKRDALIEFMRDNNVSPGVHYKPIHFYPIFKKQSLPVTERVWQTLLSIPIHPDMTEDDQIEVASVLRSFFYGN